MKNRFILTPKFLDEGLPELTALAAPDWYVNDPLLSAGKRQPRMSMLHQSLAQKVADAIGAGERPVSVAGDCCATIGVLAGLQRAGLHPFLIWFDAHGDFNTWETTPSGFLGGMPLAMLVGRGDQTLVNAVALKPFPEKRVLLTDARDLDPGEQEAVEDSDVMHLPDASALLEYPLPARPLYVHLDTDVINPADAPAMSYPAPGGASQVELQEILRSLAETGRVAAVSVSSWNPKLDEDGHTRRVCMDLLHTLLSVAQAGDEGEGDSLVEWWKGQRPGSVWTGSK
jgi:arginase